jgi:WD40 repeat protein/Tfp pilus assembly protein PilF
MRKLGVVLFIFLTTFPLLGQDDEFYLKRGQEYIGTKNYNLAIIDLTEAIKLKPNSFEAHKFRGDAYYYSRQYDRAIEDYNNAIALDTNDFRPWNNLGNVYKMKGDIDQAIDYYSESVLRNPNYFYSWYYRGELYQIKGDLDQAIEDYSKVILLNPNYPNAWYNRGGLYQRKGYPDQAIEDYRRAIALDQKLRLASERLKLLNNRTNHSERPDVKVFPNLGHLMMLTSVAFSPDGKQVLSGSMDSTVKLWDIATGLEIRTFAGHTYPVNSVAFSPDGKYILSGSDDTDTTVKLWNPDTGLEIEIFSGHTNGVNSIVFSPDGKQILSGSADNTMKLWDVTTGREVRTFTGHTNEVNSVAFNHDGSQIISGSGNLLSSDDNTVRLWDVVTGREIRTFKGHTNTVNSVTFSPDGRHILSGSSDSTVKLWDVATGSEIRTFTGHSERVSSVSFSRDGRQILSGGETIKLWDAVTGREIRSFNESVSSVSFSPDGRQILSGSSIFLYGGDIKIWDITTGRETRTFTGYTNHVNFTAFSPDGRQVLSGSSVGGIIKVWDTTTGREIRTLTDDRDLRLINLTLTKSTIFSPDGRQIILGFGNTVKLRDAVTGVEIRTFIGHTKTVNSVAFNSDGSKVLSGSSDNTMKLWDTASGRVIRTFTGHIQSVESVAFSPDGSKVLSGSPDNTMKLWDAATGREIRTFSHTYWVNSVAFSPDGRQVLSGSQDRTIKLWDITTGREIRTFTGHTSYVLSVAFSPDGGQVLSGSTDGTIKLWDAVTGREIRTFTGHTWVVNTVAFSPDGKKIISGSGDGTTRIWDTATGNEIAAFISFIGSDTQLTVNTRGSDTDAVEKNANISGEWICVTPDGYYASSPMGDRYLNVRVGNKVTGMDSFRHIFHNPDVVTARLAGKPDPITKKTANIQDAASFFPSTLILQTPATTTSGTANLTVTVSDDNQPVKNIKILVNGRLVGREELAKLTGVRGLVQEKASLTVTGEQKSFSFNIPLDVDPGQNLIEVIALNGKEAESRQKTTLTRQTDASYRHQLPNLWILAIGVNNYDNAGTDNLPFRNLNFCANDAREIVNTFKALEGKRYTKVESLLVVSGGTPKPTAENIRGSFSFLNKAGPRDIILLFLAGHGVNDKNGMFYFLPQDSVLQNGNYSNVISGDEISSVLDAPGNRLIFIDACHSGGEDGDTKRWVDNDRMLKQLMDTNAYVFASCKGNESSYELPLYSHGAFTHSILDTFKQRRNAGIFSMMDLSGTVIIDVPKRMKGMQNPVGYSLGFYDFIIGE